MWIGFLLYWGAKGKPQELISVVSVVSVVIGGTGTKNQSAFEM